MSVQYKNFIEAKSLLEKRQLEINNSLRDCEQDMEALRARYSKKCDHPTRVAQFPVCGICYAFAATAAPKDKEHDCEKGNKDKRKEIDLK